VSYSLFLSVCTTTNLTLGTTFGGQATWVEKYTVTGESTTAKFIHYKVHDGGHQWFGSAMGDDAINDIGNNNHDIHASEQLVEIFMDYRLSDFTGLAGDINGDGSIDVLDIVAAVSLIIEGEFNANGDMNLDNELNILDIVILASLILNGG